MEEKIKDEGRKRSKRDSVIRVLESHHRQELGDLIQQNERMKRQLERFQQESYKPVKKIKTINGEFQDYENNDDGSIAQNFKFVMKHIVEDVCTLI